MFLAPLAGGDATDHVGAVLDGLLGVEGALLAREPLADHLRFFGQLHVHVGLGVARPDARGCCGRISRWQD